MDYYSYEGGKWTNYFRENEERKAKLAARKAERAAKQAAKEAKTISYEVEEQQPDGSYLKI